jgi:Zn-dependent protease with chaperone function
VLCVLLVGGSVFADPPSKSDIELDRRFRLDLEKVSADAAAAWDQGIAAREQARFGDAEAAYRKASALAPNVDHPHRRLCGLYVQTTRFDEAVRECEQALALTPTSPYDKSALAQALLARGHLNDRDRGVALAHEGALALPDDVTAAQIDCLARGVARDLDDLSACVDHLLTLPPDNASSHLLASEVALTRGDAPRARMHLARAKELGLPADEFTRLSVRIDDAAKPQRTITLHDAAVVGIPVLGGWLMLFGILFLVGRRLSQATLHETEQLTADGERRSHKLYRLVLQLTGVFLYVSLPLLVVVVIAAALVTLFVFDEMGATPVVVLIGLAIVVITTIVSVARALLFTRIPKLEGKRVDPKAYPALRAVLEDAATALDTRPVDVVYLTPGADIGVLERRTLFQALFGAHCQRVLVLGVALFDNMKQRELRSILAHEYGHFRTTDTAGGLALGVRRSLVTLVNSLGNSGYALLNPAWWLLRGFTQLYLVVSAGASRRQETLADRSAIQAYGSAAFGVGLQHVITREVEFASDLAQTINDVVTNKWSLPNLYAYELERTKPASELEAAIRERMDRAPRQFDSHPTARQRIAWADKLALPGDRPHADDLEPVWALFPDPETLERDMTAIIRERARAKLGVTISDAEWDD